MMRKAKHRKHKDPSKLSSKHLVSFPLLPAQPTDHHESTKELLPQNSSLIHTIKESSNVQQQYGSNSQTTTSHQLNPRPMFSAKGDSPQSSIAVVKSPPISRSPLGMSPLSLSKQSESHNQIIVGTRKLMDEQPSQPKVVGTHLQGTPVKIAKPSLFHTSEQNSVLESKLEALKNQLAERRSSEGKDEEGRGDGFNYGNSFYQVKQHKSNAIENSQKKSSHSRSQLKQSVMNSNSVLGRPSDNNINIQRNNLSKLKSDQFRSSMSLNEDLEHIAFKQSDNSRTGNKNFVNSNKASFSNMQMHSKAFRPNKKAFSPPKPKVYPHQNQFSPISDDMINQQAQHTQSIFNYFKPVSPSSQAFGLPPLFYQQKPPPPVRLKNSPSQQYPLNGQRILHKNRSVAGEFIQADSAGSKTSNTIIQEGNSLSDNDNSQFRVSNIVFRIKPKMSDGDPKSGNQSMKNLLLNSDSSTKQLSKQRTSGKELPNSKKKRVSVLNKDKEIKGILQAFKISNSPMPTSGNLYETFKVNIQKLKEQQRKRKRYINHSYSNKDDLTRTVILLNNSQSPRDFKKLALKKEAEVKESIGQLAKNLTKVFKQISDDQHRIDEELTPSPKKDDNIATATGKGGTVYLSPTPVKDGQETQGTQANIPIIEELKMQTQNSVQLILDDSLDNSKINSEIILTPLDEEETPKLQQDSDQQCPVMHEPNQKTKGGQSDAFPTFFSNLSIRERSSQYSQSFQEKEAQSDSTNGAADTSQTGTTQMGMTQMAKAPLSIVEHSLQVPPQDPKKQSYQVFKPAGNWRRSHREKNSSFLQLFREQQSMKQKFSGLYPTSAVSTPQRMTPNSGGLQMSPPPDSRSGLALHQEGSIGSASSIPSGFQMQSKMSTKNLQIFDTNVDIDRYNHTGGKSALEKAFQTSESVTALHNKGAGTKRSYHPTNYKVAESPLYQSVNPKRGYPASRSPATRPNKEGMPSINQTLVRSVKSFSRRNFTSQKQILNMVTPTLFSADNLEKVGAIEGRGLVPKNLANNISLLSLSQKKAVVKRNEKNFSTNEVRLPTFAQSPTSSNRDIGHVDRSSLNHMFAPKPNEFEHALHLYHNFIPQKTNRPPLFGKERQLSLPKIARAPKMAITSSHEETFLLKKASKASGGKTLLAGCDTGSSEVVHTQQQSIQLSARSRSRDGRDSKNETLLGSQLEKMKKPNIEQIFNSSTLNIITTTMGMSNFREQSSLQPSPETHSTKKKRLLDINSQFIEKIKNLNKVKVGKKNPAKRIPFLEQILMSPPLPPKHYNLKLKPAQVVSPVSLGEHRTKNTLKMLGGGPGGPVEGVFSNKLLNQSYDAQSASSSKVFPPSKGNFLSGGKTAGFGKAAVKQQIPTTIASGDNVVGSKIQFLAEQLKKNINLDPTSAKGRAVFNNILKNQQMKIPTSDLLQQIQRASPSSNSPKGNSQQKENLRLLNHALASNPSVKNIIKNSSSPNSQKSIDDIYNYLEEQLHKSQMDSRKQLISNAIGVSKTEEEEQPPKALPAIGKEKHFRSVRQLLEVPFKKLNEQSQSSGTLVQKDQVSIDIGGITSWQRVGNNLSPDLPQMVPPSLLPEGKSPYHKNQSLRHSKVTSRSPVNQKMNQSQQLRGSAEIMPPTMLGSQVQRTAEAIAESTPDTNIEIYTKQIEGFPSHIGSSIVTPMDSPDLKSQSKKLQFVLKPSDQYINIFDSKKLGDSPGLRSKGSQNEWTKTQGISQQCTSQNDENDPKN